MEIMARHERASNDPPDRTRPPASLLATQGQVHARRMNPATGVATRAGSDQPPVENRVAVVVAGERGPGLALVRGLAELGMRVVMATRSVESGRNALDQLGELADRVAVRYLDLIDPDSVSGLAQTLERQLGRCEVLINILLDGEGGSVEPRASIAGSVETSLVGTWRLTQAIAPLMRRHHHGRIVYVINGVGGSDPMGPTNTAWQPTMSVLTRILAEELADGGILVNACCVGAPEHTAEGLDFSTAVATAAWLATVPDDGPSGAYFRDRQPIEW